MYDPDQKDKKILLALICFSFLSVGFLVLQINFGSTNKKLDTGFLEQTSNSCIDIVPCIKVLAKYRQKVSDLAESYNVTVDTLISANDFIQDAEQRLDKDVQVRIPDESGVYYIVQEGDTLETIFEKHKVEITDETQKNFFELNGVNREGLKPNLRLFIPEGTLMRETET